jgi:hypothetical protein
MKKIPLILSFLLLCINSLFASEIKLVATATKTNVGVGEQFEVDFSLNSNGDHFTPPNFPDFAVLSGPNFSSSMASVNGDATFNTTFSYIVAATKEGTFTISAAAIIVNGHTIVSNSLKIKVKGQAPPQQNVQPQQQAQQAPPDDDSTPPDTKNLAKSLFIKAVVDKTSAYAGEQITVSYKIYFRVNCQPIQVDKAPDLNGFWSQDVANTKPSQQTETYNGLKYYTAILKKTILFPEHAGDLTIDPLAMTLMVRVPIKGVFDNPFGNFQDIKYQVKSAPVTIHVTPLPAAGKPANFSGAVGTFTVNSDVDKKELKANETLNYSFEVLGSGNLNLINAPTITPPPDIEKYDPKTDDHITVDDKGVSGSRKYSYLLIPRHEGEYTLNPITSFSYFNPTTKRYVTLPVQGYHIKVDKGDAQANVPAFNSTNQQDIQMLNKDIRYIKTGSFSLYKDGEGFYGSFGFYTLLVLGPLLFGAAFYYRRWDDKQNSDIVKVRSRKASKVAAKHLANANKQLVAGNKTLFYEAVTRGLYGYLSDKLNIPFADLNKENIIEGLQAKSLDAAVIKQLTDTMDLCEMARFAPISGISEQEVFDKAKNTINDIEDKI